MKAYILPAGVKKFGQLPLIEPYTSIPCEKRNIRSAVIRAVKNYFCPVIFHI